MGASTDLVGLVAQIERAHLETRTGWAGVKSGSAAANI
jgi:hypothetical protein